MVLRVLTIADRIEISTGMKAGRLRRALRGLVSGARSASRDAVTATPMAPIVLSAPT